MKKVRDSKSASRLLSMTGYGRALKERNGLCIEVEVKTVNHRYLDLSLKLPRVYNQFEMDLRALVSEKVGRGRVEMLVNRIDRRGAQSGLSFREGRFENLLKAYRKALKSAGLAAASGDTQTQIVLSILARSEIVGTEEDLGVSSNERGDLFTSCEKALSALTTMRAVEGGRLQKDLVKRLSDLSRQRSLIQKRVVNMPEVFRNRILARLEKLTPEIRLDPSRLAAEVALLTERADVTEELVRLESHLQQFKQTLLKKPEGKKLDFLLQEIAREFNTVAVKSQDAEVQGGVVDAKTELEKMREQVQNIA